MRNILESIVRWYFKRYHPTKLTTIVMEHNWYEVGDIMINSYKERYLYLGKEVYLALEKPSEYRKLVKQQLENDGIQNK